MGSKNKFFIDFAIFFIAVFVVTATIIALTGNSAAAMCTATFMTVLFIMFYHLERINKTSTEQQAQIDTLTRELEEVKRKLEK